MPGTSGLLSPFSNIKGLYFDEKNEPDTFGYNFNKDIRRILESKNYDCIGIRAHNSEDYNRILNDIWKINNQIRITTTSLNDLDIIIENDDVNLNNRDNFVS